jgi:hypothetical protein
LQSFLSSFLFINVFKHLTNLVLKVSLRVKDNLCLIVSFVLYYYLAFLIIALKVSKVIVSKCLNLFKGFTFYKGYCL